MDALSLYEEVQRLQNQIDIETKIKDGAENLLSVFDLKLASTTKQDLRKQIESELDSANSKIASLTAELERCRQVHAATSPPSWASTTSDSDSAWHILASTVSRFEQSALGFEGRPLFGGGGSGSAQAGPSRPAARNNPSYDILPTHLDSNNGSPPSTNYVNDLGSGIHHHPSAAPPPFRGLGIGLDGHAPLTLAGSRSISEPLQSSRPPPLLFDRSAGSHDDASASTSATAAAARGAAAPALPLGPDSAHAHDREVEDARASRSLAVMLIRSLRPSSPMPPPAKLPTLSERAASISPGSTSPRPRPSEHASAAVQPHNAATTAITDPDSPLNPNLALPRMARRTAARSRAAAIAAGASAHARTPSNATGLGDQAKHQIDQINRLVDILKRHARVRYELPLDDLVDAAMPNLCDRAGKEVRAATYRLLRHALVQPLWPLVSRCRGKGLDIYLSRTLIRDNRFELEKIQAIKLIRAIMELAALRSIATAPDRLALDLEDLLSSGVVRALAAVAGHPEDKLRNICLETLAELAVFDVRLLIKSGGLRSTLQALTEGATEFSPTLVQVFIYLVDMPGTRQHLRPGVDLEIALSGFTETPVQKPITYDALLRCTASVVTVLLRSWAGLIYLCMDDKRAIKSLVQALRVNTLDVKSVLLDMLYDLFNVRGATGRTDPASKRESSHKAPSSSPKLDADATTPVKGGIAPLGELGDQPRSRLNLVDHYLALLLVVFFQSGLVDALIDVIEHAPTMARKATMLMGELLQVSKRVHPPSMGGNIHSLPRLFSLAANFRLDKSDERQAAASALASIDSANRHRAHHEAISSAAALSGNVQSTARDRSNSVEESMRRGQRQVEKTKMRMGMQIDDVQFRNMMVDTQILVTKDHSKWNLDVLTEMLEGPLLNAKRLDDVVKGTKLLKRVLAFYHPFALRFASIRKLKANRCFVRLGCLLLSTLAATPEGVRVLLEDRLLREIRECLDQLDPLSGLSTSDPLLSRKRMEETLTSGYFEMIGILTQTAEGIRVLERFKIFTPLYHLSALRSRDDIVKAVIENVDYSIDGHSRIILAKALTSSYRDVRLFATRHLAELIRQQTLPANAKSGSDVQGDWTIGLLLTQLYDPSVDVRQLATKVVEEACTSSHILEKVVSMRPTLDHLGELGHPLLLKFLSTSVGIRYLWQCEYIDREMDEWFNERNQRYVVEVEVMLADFFSIYRKSPSNGAAGGASMSGPASAFVTPPPPPPSTRADPSKDGVVPPHFYGELAKTPEGCHILQQKGHFAEFAHFIRQHGAETSDSELINKLKSVLWAVGSIGANELGLPFLEAEDMISQIVEIAETSPVLSIRGTCFFVLGLVASTNSGAEALQDYGWQSVCTPLGAPMGLCIPDDFNRLVSIERWEVNKVSDLSYLELAEPETLVVNKIITSIANLGNSILATNASRSLSKLKAKHKSVFKDLSVLARALELMDHFYYRVSVRRYIWELFDVNLDEDVVQEIRASRQRLMEAKRSRSAPPGRSLSRAGLKHANHSPRQRGGSMDQVAANATQNGTRRHSTADQRSSSQSRDRKQQQQQQQQAGLSALAGDDHSSHSDSDRDSASSLPHLTRRGRGSGLARYGEEHDSEEDEGEDDTDSDADADEVGLSSNLSSDDEASDGSVDDSKQLLHPEHVVSRGMSKTAASGTATRRGSIRSSTLKGHWSGRHEAIEAQKVVSAPAKKVVGFGVEEL
ncbi:related to protein ste16 [Sporisorium reilianum f. sp. reilianum]|uniref:Related to protein ste16 n=1 Tax=Sporisorium reilianum f. sp. reilianum TaxID=72559 RepID=A0A2N8UNQ8_9BASI|nr:related to protein ste16 [Sporisorium reilianum f. sp. reilianum]